MLATVAILALPRALPLPDGAAAAAATAAATTPPPPRAPEPDADAEPLRAPADDPVPGADGADADADPAGDGVHSSPAVDAPAVAVAAPVLGTPPGPAAPPPPPGNENGASVSDVLRRNLPGEHGGISPGEIFREGLTMVRNTSPSTGVTTKGDVVEDVGAIGADPGAAAGPGGGTTTTTAASWLTVRATGVAEAATDVGITASDMALREQQRGRRQSQCAAWPAAGRVVDTSVTVDVEVTVEEYFVSLALACEGAVVPGD